MPKKRPPSKTPECDTTNFKLGRDQLQLQKFLTELKDRIGRRDGKYRAHVRKKGLKTHRACTMTMAKKTKAMIGVGCGIGFSLASASALRRDGVHRDGHGHGRGHHGHGKVATISGAAVRRPEKDGSRRRADGLTVWRRQPHPTIRTSGWACPQTAQRSPAPAASVPAAVAGAIAGVRTGVPYIAPDMFYGRARGILFFERTARCKLQGHLSLADDFAAAAAGRHSGGYADGSVEK